MRSIVTSCLYRGFVRALRSYRSATSSSLMVTFAFGICIALTTLVFSIVDAVVIRPLPFHEPSRLALIWRTPRSVVPLDKVFISAPEYLMWRRGLTTVEDIAAVQPSSFKLRSQSGNLRIEGNKVSGNFFRLLGARFILGYDFPENRSPNDVQTVVISEQFWASEFERDPSICEKTILIDDQPARIAGVLPSNFHFDYSAPEDIWSLLPNKDLAHSPEGVRGYVVLSRLRDHVDIAQLDAELRSLDLNIDPKPQLNGNMLFGYAQPLRDWSLHDSPQISLTVMFIIILVAAISVGNIAMLFLARATASIEGLRIRLALGARVSMLALEMLAEGVTLAFAGFALAALIVELSMPYFGGIIPTDLPRAGELSIDWRIWAFGIGVTLLATFLSTLPAILYSSASAKSTSVALMDRAGPSNNKIATIVLNWVTALQFAFVVVVLTIAALSAFNFWLLMRSDLGFKSDHVLAGRIYCPARDSNGEAAFYRDVITQIREIPGIQSAALSTSYPLGDVDSSVDVMAIGSNLHSESAYIKVGLRAVTNDYFETMDIPILRGQSLSGTFTPESSVNVEVVINRQLAFRFWGTDDALGRNVVLKLEQDEPTVAARVVGVCGNVRQNGLSPSDVEPEVYLPPSYNPFRFMYVVARTEGPPSQYFERVRQEVSSFDESQSFAQDQFISLNIIIARILERPRFYALSLITISLGSMLMALLGLYAVVSQMLVRRYREIGIRRSLGASFWRVVSAMSRSVISSIMAGASCGVLCSFYVVSLVQSRLNFSYNYAWESRFCALGLSIVCVLIALLIPVMTVIMISPAQLMRYE